MVLAGKVALITGASSGIGEAIAISLAEWGATVALSARRADRLEALVKQIEGTGGKAIAIPGDVAIEADATHAVEETIRQLGRIDILVNSAGIMLFGGVETVSLDEWRRIIDINLLGTLYTCKAALGPMKAQGSGDIINISSTAGRNASGSANAYATSKFGVNALSEGLRQEVGGYGIRVCIVEPGATKSEVYDSIADPQQRAFLKDHVEKQSALAASDVADTVRFMIALPRRANLAEILIVPTSDTKPM